MAPSASNTFRSYDVFLSFCGKDTRKTIISHLYQELYRQGITTFKDDEELERGTYITPTLLQAIRNSKIAIIIVSENYALSSYCLEELVEIMKQREKDSLEAIPIFYNIDPSVVRKSEGRLQEAFEKHRKGNEQKIESWKEAMAQAANIVGEHSVNRKDDAELINEILKDVNAKLIHRMPPKPNPLVGMDTHMESLMPLLGIESLEEVRMINICGMGGIGKSTIATYIMKTFHHLFEATFYIEDIRKVYKDFGERNLQMSFLSQILGMKEMPIPPYVDVSCVIKERLRHRKVLAVFDDVSEIDQLNCLATSNDSFAAGSRIIITSRNKRLLPQSNGYYVYEVRYLNHKDAVRLLRQYAFNGEPRGIQYLDLSDQAAKYACGVPLVLKVWGSHLREQEMIYWKATIKELKKNLAMNIKSALKVSFDALVEKAKDIFLYIACYFGEESIDRLKSLLTFKHQNVEFWIRELVNKSLLDSWNDRFSYCYVRVHDVLREMGHDIVREQSAGYIGRSQFLISPSDVREVLEHELGTEKVEVISLDMAKVDHLRIGEKAFQKMYNLRFLNFFHSDRSRKPKIDIEKMEDLPCNLVQLIWERFPMCKLPRKFWPECLVELNLRESKVKRLWEGKVFLPHLQVLTLEGCSLLKQCPNLTMTPELNKLDLSRTAIKELSSSIGCLSKLKELYLKDLGIKELPSSIEYLSKLIILWLDGTRIKELPSTIGCMTELVVLTLVDTRIKELPSSIGCLSKLIHLDLSGSGILELPTSIGYLSNLELLSLYGTRIKELPSSIGCLSVLERLVLRDSRMKKLASEVSKEIRRRFVRLDSLRPLISLPRVFPSVSFEFRKAPGRFLELMENRLIYFSEDGLQIENWNLKEFPILNEEDAEDYFPLKSGFVRIGKPKSYRLLALLETKVPFYGSCRHFISTPQVILESDDMVTLKLEETMVVTWYHPLFVEGEVDVEENWGEIVSKVLEESESESIGNDREALFVRDNARCNRKVLETIKNPTKKLWIWSLAIVFVFLMMLMKVGKSNECCSKKGLRR